MSETHAALQLENVTKRFGNVVALDDLSLSVESGTYHCLLGPNGSGKSTLLRIVLGLAQPDSGTIDGPHGRVGCGFQSPNFYPGLTVRQNIETFAQLAGGNDWGWNQTVVDELRLNPALDREAGDLSGGYARKLDLALALIKQPDMLLLDEPLGALDDVSKERLLGFLEWYVEEGNTVLVSTHHVSAFEQSLDRVTVLHRGNILRDEWMAELELDNHDSLQAHYVDSVLAADGPQSFEQQLE